jgi:hypothetical protein
MADQTQDQVSSGGGGGRLRLLPVRPFFTQYDNATADINAAIEKLSSLYGDLILESEKIDEMVSLLQKVVDFGGDKLDTNPAKQQT